MALIKQNDLNLKYNWSTEPGETAVNKDSITNKSFDRERGDDVLNVLNDYAEKSEIEHKDDLEDVENLLRQELPKDLDTHNDVLDWLWSTLGHEERV
jgi:hypothetical protein